MLIGMARYRLGVTELNRVILAALVFGIMNVAAGMEKACAIRKHREQNYTNCG